MVETYSETYHMRIKCTSKEAPENTKFFSVSKNPTLGKYKNRIKLKQGKVYGMRTKCDSLEEKIEKKDKRGRFLGKRATMDKARQNSYLTNQILMKFSRRA